MPRVHADLVGESLRLCFEQILVLFGKRSGLARIVVFQRHPACFHVLKRHSFGAESCGAKVSRVDFLKSKIGKV